MMLHSYRKFRLYREREEFVYVCVDHAAYIEKLDDESTILHLVNGETLIVSEDLKTVIEKLETGSYREDD